MSRNSWVNINLSICSIGYMEGSIYFVFLVWLVIDSILICYLLANSFNPFLEWLSRICIYVFDVIIVFFGLSVHFHALSNICYIRFLQYAIMCFSDHHNWNLMLFLFLCVLLKLSFRFRVREYWWLIVSNIYFWVF